MPACSLTWNQKRRCGALQREPVAPATEIYETLEQQTRIRARFRRVREMLAEQDHILTVDAAGNREDIARQVYTLWQELALG